MGLCHTIHDRIYVKIALSMAIVATFIFSSCGYSENKTIAENGVATFHSRLDSGQIHAIYSEADDRFRKSTTEADFDALMDAIHRKLGDVQQSQLTNFQVGYYTGQGSVVMLVYETRFAGGTGTEDFVWHIQDKRPLLVGYHINSNALILK